MSLEILASNATTARHVAQLAHARVARLTADLMRATLEAASSDEAVTHADRALEVATAAVRAGETDSQRPRPVQAARVRMETRPDRPLVSLMQPLTVIERMGR